MGIIISHYKDQGQKQPVSSSIIRVRVLKCCSIGFFKTETPPLWFSYPPQFSQHQIRHVRQSPSCNITFHPKHQALWVYLSVGSCFGGLSRTEASAWYLNTRPLPPGPLPRMANFLLQVICCFTAFIQRPRKQCKKTCHENIFTLLKKLQIIYLHSDHLDF